MNGYEAFSSKYRNQLRQSPAIPPKPNFPLDGDGNHPNAPGVLQKSRIGGVEDHRHVTVFGELPNMLKKESLDRHLSSRDKADFLSHSVFWGSSDSYFTKFQAEIRLLLKRLCTSIIQITPWRSGRKYRKN